MTLSVWFGGFEVGSVVEGNQFVWGVGDRGDVDDGCGAVVDGESVHCGVG